MPEIHDDKSPVVIPFILAKLKEHQTKHDDTPFFVGINGIQGSGKSTLVSALQKTLSEAPHSHATLAFSIDDLYLPHSEQVKLARSHPNNPLVQHRGQPSTHDLALGTALFQRLKDRETNIPVPRYDKSAFDGQGDLRRRGAWSIVNGTAADVGAKKVQVVLFEGWCVGFRPLSDADLEKKWTAAKAEADDSSQKYLGRLGKQRFEDVKFVNDALKGYDRLTDYLDAFVHIDAEDTQYVYAWRQEQEAAMRKSQNTGMTEEQVVHFVNGYYPAYELYTETLRSGIFPERKSEGEKDGVNRQLRLVVGRDRKVVQTLEI